MPDFYGRYSGIFGGGGGGGGSGTAPLADKVALSATDTSTVVAFGSVFGSAAVVVAVLSSTNSSADFIPVQISTPTNAGFTAYYGTEIPDSTYTLHWIASAVND